MTHSQQLATTSSQLARQATITNSRITTSLVMMVYQFQIFECLECLSLDADSHPLDYTRHYGQAAALAWSDHAVQLRKYEEIVDVTLETRMSC
jgi:hypothetical protein